ncbi:MAG: RiPP maturation radical SAM C-methyltransferase, partial [Crocinitomicaceae bacterium]
MSNLSHIPVLNREVDVSLILMPYASLERPSIALSILKSSLNNIGVSSSVVYGNIMLAEKIGAHIYDVINKSQSNILIGEWTFSGTLFPEHDPSSESYFEQIGYGLDTLQPYIKHLGSEMNIREVVTIIRNIAGEYINDLAHQVLATKPKIVGCSSTFQQHCASLAILKRIKELDASIVTMIGGANCEASMGIVTHKECDWLDYVVSGEADILFPELTRSILDGLHLGLKELPYGVIGPRHREENLYQMLALKPPRAKLKSMGDSPVPDYDDYFEFVEHSTCGQFIKPGLLLESSRGCWWG